MPNVACQVEIIMGTKSRVKMQTHGCISREVWYNNESVILIDEWRLYEQSKSSSPLQSATRLDQTNDQKMTGCPERRKFFG